MHASDLFALPPSLCRFGEFFPADRPPWEWVAAIGRALADVKSNQRPDVPAGVVIRGEVWLHATVKLPPQAVIEGPAWIGPECEIRPGAWIRGNVIAGKGCVIGHASEFKNCLLLDHAQAPHFNYVGDSVLGNKAHLGAGVICANLRLDQKPVQVQTPDGRCDSGMRKLGALMGDAAEAGCNAVLQPGCVLYPRAIVLSGIAFSGMLEANTLAVVRQKIDRLPRRT